MIRVKMFKEVKVKLPAAKIQELCKHVIKEEADPDSDGSINIIFTDDSHIQKLNKSYRGKNKSTDVLSFNVESPDNKDAVFGEIYISVPATLRQSKEYGFSPGDEMLRLICHGLLHLFGYDHIKTDERLKMEAREKCFLENRVAFLS